MSPEIYAGSEMKKYGYEVDMWAFGILFFFMLNVEFPFSKQLSMKELKENWNTEMKCAELKKMATNFSYSKAV